MSMDSPDGGLMSSPRLALLRSLIANDGFAMPLQSLDQPATLEPQHQRNAESALAAAIHYPKCWDVMAYPTLEAALSEVYACFKCSECGAKNATTAAKVD